MVNFLNYNKYKGPPRGLIDLCGIFKDFDNELVAKEILNLYPDKKIIYFKNDTAYQIYNDENIEEFNEDINDNYFYYYDQAHTVGSDLKQPQTGNIVVIIDDKTRYTDFAQAIFRFRKLNNGTYLTVIMDTKKEKYSIDEIYTLLNENEEKFNKNQQDGLKFQLLKTLVRKKTNNYEEIDLQPDFLRSEIKNHHQKLSKISGLSIAEIEESEYQIYKHISFISEEQIKTEHWLAAHKLVNDIDPKDTHYVAYSKQFKCKIWSGDKALIKGLSAKGFTNFITADALYNLRKNA
jgi:predicted nucleic acid-binding protein